MIEIIKLAHEEGAQVVDMYLSSNDSSRLVSSLEIKCF